MYLMKRFLVAGLILVLLILDWAALDDITTGNEPDYLLEYIILLSSLFVFGILGIVFLKQRKSKR